MPKAKKSPSSAISVAAVRALIRSLGMVAENRARELRGEGVLYTEKDFLQVMEDEGLNK